MIHILEDLTHKIEGQPPSPPKKRCHLGSRTLKALLKDPERKPSLWHLRATHFFQFMSSFGCHNSQLCSSILGISKGNLSHPKNEGLKNMHPLIGGGGWKNPVRTFNEWSSLSTLKFTMTLSTAWNQPGFRTEMHEELPT